MEDRTRPAKVTTNLIQASDEIIEEDSNESFSLTELSMQEEAEIAAKFQIKQKESQS